MKKINIIAIVGMGVLASVSVAQARPLVCPYTDTIHVTSTSAPAGTGIIAGSISANGNVTAQETNNVSFNINSKSCDDWSANGTVAVSYNLGSNNACTLKFTDSAVQDNPSVEVVSCSGKQFRAHLSYDGILSYSYTLYLEQ